MQKKNGRGPGHFHWMSTRVPVYLWRWSWEKLFFCPRSWMEDFLFFEATAGKLLNIWGVRLVVWGPAKGPGCCPLRISIPSTKIPQNWQLASLICHAWGLGPRDAKLECKGCHQATLGRVLFPPPLWRVQSWEVASSQSSFPSSLKDS